MPGKDTTGLSGKYWAADAGSLPSKRRRAKAELGPKETPSRAKATSKDKFKKSKGSLSKKSHSCNQSSPDSSDSDSDDLETFEKFACFRVRNTMLPSDYDVNVWDVAFEPDPQNPDRTTSLVAACGGNNIMFFDVVEGTREMEFPHDDPREEFYTLAWTTLQLGPEKSNILVSGGLCGEIRMFHPEKKVCYHHFRSVDEGAGVYSLAFHSERPTWLFCGSSDGSVSLWDIGVPTLPDYDVEPRRLLELLPGSGPVNHVVWTGDNRWLLAATDRGLLGWNLDDNQILAPNVYNPQTVDFLLPSSERASDDVVDGLAVASKWNIVAKMAHHGRIYIWNLQNTIKEISANNECDVDLLAKLRWSNTDENYINVGCHKGKGLICCGDDKGTLWLYDVPQLGQDFAEPIRDTMEPTTRLRWPELEDDLLDADSEALPDKNNVINKVAVSHDGERVVAVTANNLLCVWKKCF